ncbi:MAG: hypothetical protein AB7S75_05865 [Desulfococcaceae bacterium]
MCTSIRTRMMAQNMSMSMRMHTHIAMPMNTAIRIPTKGRQMITAMIIQAIMVRMIMIIRIMAKAPMNIPTNRMGWAAKQCSRGFQEKV